MARNGKRGWTRKAGLVLVPNILQISPGCCDVVERAVMISALECVYHRELRFNQRGFQV